jgi:hypothetical protein
MKCFHNIDLGWAIGDIGSLFKEAKEIATKCDVKVSFDFNGVKVNMSKDSTLEHIWPRLQEAMKGKNLSCFGEGW